MKENRQGCLKVNWPQAKRDRPGPFASNQTTFEHFFEVLKSPAACRKDFFDKLRPRNPKGFRGLFSVWRSVEHNGVDRLNERHRRAPLHQTKRFAVQRARQFSPSKR